MVFECDPEKEAINLFKHGVDFTTVGSAFSDPCRVIALDRKHSVQESRWQCIGHDGHGILTFTFTLRAGTVRVINAGYWRKGRKIYEKKSP